MHSWPVHRWLLPILELRLIITSFQRPDFNYCIHGSCRKLFGITWKFYIDKTCHRSTPWHRRLFRNRIKFILPVLIWSYQIKIESSRHPTAKCYEEDAIVTIVSFNTMLYISRSFFPPESMFSWFVLLYSNFLFFWYLVLLYASFNFLDMPLSKAVNNLKSIFFYINWSAAQHIDIINLW